MNLFLVDSKNSLLSFKVPLSIKSKTINSAIVVMI